MLIYFQINKLFLNVLSSRRHNKRAKFVSHVMYSYFTIWTGKVVLVIGQPD